MWPFKKRGSTNKPVSGNAAFNMAIVISRDEVQRMDISRPLETLKALMSDPATARRNKESMDISFSGYDHTSEELFEMPEVREYVHKLDHEFPYWLFFLSKRGLGLQCIMYCHLLPHLTPEARATRHPQQLEQLLLKRWFPAMNAVSEFAGLSEADIEVLTERSMRYFMEGRERG